MTNRTSDSILLADVFVDRWSPRAFSPAPVTEEQLASVFEAARWAPSWMNNQPWYFLYATEGPDRDAFLDVFMDFNRDWAAKAPVIGLILARTELEGFMGRTRDFDVGAATMAMTLQATMLGLSVHLLGGVDVDASFALTGANRDTTEILAGFVMGHQGDPSTLPESLQAKEQASDRKPAAAFALRSTRLPD